MLEAVPTLFIEKYANVLKKNQNFSVPKWFEYVKTGHGKEMPPEDADWFYTRAASIVRKIYLSEEVCYAKIRAAYGCKKRRGSKPARRSRASGSVIKNLLIALEAVGIIIKKEKIYRINEKAISEIETIAEENVTSNLN